MEGVLIRYGPHRTTSQAKDTRLPATWLATCCSLWPDARGTGVYVRLAAGKGYKEVQIVDPDKLTPDEKKQQSVLFTYITKNAKRLKDEVKQNTGITMPIGDARVDTFRSYILREVNAGMAEVRCPRHSGLLTARRPWCRSCCGCGVGDRVWCVPVPRGVSADQATARRRDGAVQRVAPQAACC